MGKTNRRNSYKNIMGRRDFVKSSSLVAVMLQMYVSDKSVYMVNPFFNYDDNRLRHDLKQYSGITCTERRFDPSGMKILVTKGEVIDGITTEGYGCEQSVTMKVPDCYELRKSSQNYEHHFSGI